MGDKMSLDDELKEIGHADEAGEAEMRPGGFEGGDQVHWKVVRKHAWTLFDQGKFEEAFDRFEEALAEFRAAEPGKIDNAQIIQGKAACLRKHGQMDVAEETLDMAEARGIDSIGLRCERGWLWNDRSNMEVDPEKALRAKVKAAESFEHALNGVRSDEEEEKEGDGNFLWASQFWREAGQYDKAEKVVLTALSKFADQARLNTERGWINFYRRDFAGAVDDFDKALEKAPKLDSALQGKIAALREAGRLDAAKAVLQDALASVGEVPGLQSEKAWIALAERKPLEAAGIFEALAAGSGDDHDKLNLAFALLEIETEEKARQRAVELCRPLCYGRLAAQAYGCLGFAAFRNGDIAGAEYYLKRSIEKNERLGRHADLIRLYTFLGRSEEARELLAKAIRIKPNEMALLTAGGELFLEAGEPARARDYFTQGLRKNPQSVTCLIGFADALLALKEVENAETVLRQGLKAIREKDRPEARLMLARILCIRYDQTQNSRFLDEALIEAHDNNQHGNHREAAFHQGVIRFKRGELYEAQAAFARAINNGNRNPYASINAERIRLMISEAKPGKMANVGGYLVVAVSLVQLFLVWQSWVQPAAAKWFDVSPAAALVIVPLSAVMMIAGFSLPYLTKFSVSGVEVELVSPGPATRPEGPVGDIRFQEKVRGGQSI